MIPQESWILDYFEIFVNGNLAHVVDLCSAGKNCAFRTAATPLQIIEAWLLLTAYWNFSSPYPTVGYFSLPHTTYGLITLHALQTTDNRQTTHIVDDRIQGIDRLTLIEYQY